MRQLLVNRYSLFSVKIRLKIYESFFRQTFVLQRKFWQRLFWIFKLLKIRVLK